VIQLPTTPQHGPQAQRRAKRAIYLAIPALMVVAAAAWLGLETVRALQLAYAPVQSHGAVEQPMLATKVPDPRQNEEARLPSPADVEAPMADKPIENVVEPAQIDRQSVQHMNPAPRLDPPEAIVKVIAVPVTTEPPVAAPQPEDCASELRRFAQDQIIRFSVGRADLEDADLPILRRIGRMAEECPNVVVQVKGHTDSTGSDVINLALSWQRADNTIATLAALGIDTQNFEPIGFGARAPLTQGDSSDDHFDRRVEFRVFTTNETTQ